MRKEAPVAVRKRVRRRDGERCRWCGSSSGLEVHHILYRSELGPHEDRNLITLCNQHHALAHSSKSTYQPVLIETLRLFYDEKVFLMVPQVIARMNRAKETPCP